MWPLLSKLLSAVGKPGFAFIAPTSGFSIGNPLQPDSLGGGLWRNFARTEPLWKTWGPVEGSPWEPFHCVTLFAALDIATRKTPANVGPRPDAEMDTWLRPPAPLPDWTRGPGLMVVLDLPGPHAVSVARHFVRGGFQPVCTFDNWPNKAGVLKPERLLGTLLHYAAELAHERTRLAAASPPLWICDSDRFSQGKPGPGLYDNRYCLEDRLLPGPALLRSAGIRSLVYVGSSGAKAPTPDLAMYFRELIGAGFELRTVACASAAAFEKAEPMPAPNSRPALARLNDLVRSSAGGFGGIVPTPSSSSGG